VTIQIIIWRVSVVMHVKDDDVGRDGWGGTSGHRVPTNRTSLHTHQRNRNLSQQSRKL